jgi:hypothetical protein
MNPRLSTAVHAAQTAVVKNWRPFLLIQTAAVVLVAAYYLLPGAANATQWLADIKVRGGLLFAAVATALAGGALPELAKRLTKSGNRGLKASDVAFQLAFFGFLGITIDLLYRGLAVLFGAAATPAIVFKKVLFDQFVYSPFISMILGTTLFLWKDAGFSAKQTAAAFHDGTWASRYISLLLLCWAFWIPMLACVYAMPTNLQFILFLCADGAWGLLLLSISGH